MHLFAFSAKRTEPASANLTSPNAVVGSTAKIESMRKNEGPSIVSLIATTRYPPIMAPDNALTA